MNLFEKDELLFYYDHPVEFVEDQILGIAKHVMGPLSLTPDQKYFLQAIGENNRVTVESGHGTGKSACFSFAAIWYNTTRFNLSGQPIHTVCIAPTYHQLHDILWPEFNRWIPLSRLRNFFTLLHDEIFVVGQKEFDFIRARSPSKPDNLQGFHAPHLLWLCDEAFGIPNDIWETVEGSLTQEDNKIVLAGQHTVITGYVHETFNSDKAWKALRFNAENSPLAKPEYAKRIANKYGINSDVYRVRVLGMPPKGNPDAFIQFFQVQEACKRIVPEMGDLCIGLDCARFGDDSTVLTIRKGNYVYPQIAGSGMNTQETEKFVLDNLRKYRKEHEDKGVCTINVDATGGFGAGVIDLLLLNREDNIIVNGINFTGNIIDDEYATGVSKMFGELRERLPQMHLSHNDFLVEELSTRKFSVNKDGKVAIQTKDDFKKDYGSSPDHADSLILAVAKQAIPQKVLQPMTAQFVSDFEIDFYKLHEYSTLYCSQWVEKSMKSSCILALWSSVSGKLYIFHSVTFQNSAADTVFVDLCKTVKVYTKGFVTNLAKFTWIGNNLMFKDQANSLMDAYAKYGQYILDNPQYEQFGAIGLTLRLFQRKGIIVQERCRELIEQAQKWIIDNGKPEEGFGLCLALCNLISTLSETGALKLEQPFKVYSRDKTKYNEILGQAIKDGRAESMTEEEIKELARVNPDTHMQKGDVQGMW